MKREDLEKLGLTKEQIDSVCDLNNADVQPLKDELQKAQDDLKAAQDKVATTESALKKFDGVDAEALKKQIEDLKADLKKNEETHASEIASRDFNDRLKECITSANGRNAKAITALLDIDVLKGSKNQKEDIAAALKKLAEAEELHGRRQQELERISGQWDCLRQRRKNKCPIRLLYPKVLQPH